MNVQVALTTVTGQTHTIVTDDYATLEQAQSTFSGVMRNPNSVLTFRDQNGTLMSVAGSHLVSAAFTPAS